MRYLQVVLVALLMLHGLSGCDNGNSGSGDNCQSTCTWHECGDDGCGGTCGTCPGAAPFCNNGLCSTECVSDEGCTDPGLMACVDGTSLHTCEQVADGCYQWGETTACAEGYICKNGGCVSPDAKCGDVTPVVGGKLKNNVADIDFTDEEVTIQLHHKLDIDEWEDGCISKYVMEFSKMGLGCNFHLEMSTGADKAMSATKAILKADSFCPGWSDADEGEYVLESSTLTFCSTVEIADYMTESACISDVMLEFGGLLYLVRTTDGKGLEVDLSDLQVVGDMTSSGDTELVCPEPCGGKECGPDGCGGSCGECQDDLVCGEAGLCVESCSGKECGFDTNGISCGQCDVGWQCDDGGQCFNPCAGKDCGDDGYGGSCGNCPQGMNCVSTTCVPDVSEECDLEIGPPAPLEFAYIWPSNPPNTMSKYMTLINRGKSPCTVNSVFVTDVWNGISNNFSLSENWSQGTTVAALSIEAIEVVFTYGNAIETGIVHVSHEHPVLGTTEDLLDLLLSSREECELPIAVLGSAADYVGLEAGKSVVLDACVSQAGECGYPIGENNYIWQLLEKPDDSVAYLNTVSTCSASFFADKAGMYRVALVVFTSMTNAQSEVTTVDIEVAPAQ